MASIYKRDNSYRVQFYKNGQSRQRQFRTRKEARIFAEKVGTKHIPLLSSVTVEDAARKYLSACIVGRDGHAPLEAATIELYRGYIDNWIVPDLGKVKIAKIAPSTVREFRDQIIADNTVARSTAKKIVGTLKRILGHGVLCEDISVNPGAGITVRMSRRREKRIEVPPIEVVTNLLQKARELSVSDDLRTRNAWVRYYPFLRILATTGARLSEVRGLTRAAWNKDDSSLRIFQRADKFGVIGPVKSAAAQRTVFVDKETNELIERQLGSHNADLIFASKGGLPLDAHNIAKRLWMPLVVALDVDRATTIHHLRHFYASRLIAMGETVKEVSAALGHEDEAFTLRVYGHLFQDRDSIERRKKRAEALLISTPTPSAP